MTIASAGTPAVSLGGVAIVRPCISLSVQPSNRSCGRRDPPRLLASSLVAREVYLDLERFENTKFMSDKDFRHDEGFLRVPSRSRQGLESA